MCNEFVHWWDGEYEGTCLLTKGHSGDHFDGDAWFDENGDLVRWADDTHAIGGDEGA